MGLLIRTVETKGLIRTQPHTWHDKQNGNQS